MNFDIQINDRGQITIPKEIREKAKFHPQDTIKIELDDQGRIVLYKNDFFDDLEDLIIRDLLSEGYTEEDLAEKIPERKKELANALLKMVKESEKEIKKGEYVTLEELKVELEEEEH